MATQYNHGMGGLSHGIGGNSQMPNGLSEPLKASQACLVCRKQKRKCDKALPGCSLCQRMNRHCDYSDSSPQPTSDDYHSLKKEVADLKQLLQGGGHPGGNAIVSSTEVPPPSSSLSGPEAMAQQAQNYIPQQEYPWHGIQNRFPAFAFLDSSSFKAGGITVPKPNIDIPGDVLAILGDGVSVQEMLNIYFMTVHKWMPIVSKKRIEVHMENPLWVFGPDTALLFLCMKLVCSRPQDGIESSQTEIYMSAKRFLSLVEVTGTVSLLVLQAGLLVVWYEYGQAIYPAAYMSSGWCKRYGILLGITGHPSAYEMLGRLETWTEQEERRRTWWGVLITDRVLKIGSQGHILNSQEPKDDTLLPANDNAWDDGDMTKVVQRSVSTAVDFPLGPFPRLCQAYIMLGKVFSHHHGDSAASEMEHFSTASQLYHDSSALTTKILDEAGSTPDYLALATPLALTFSTLYALCEPYSCPPSGQPVNSEEASKMQTQAIEGLNYVSGTVVDFAGQLNAVAPLAHDLDSISPLVMDSLYSAASHHAWQVRESGDQSSQVALDSIRHSLRRLGTRWRNAAEYLRFLEAQEFHYAVRAGA